MVEVSAGRLVVGLCLFPFGADTEQPFWGMNIASTAGHRSCTRSSRGVYHWNGHGKTVRLGVSILSCGWLIVGLCLFPFETDKGYPFWGMYSELTAGHRTFTR